jgi:uncharacterized protein YegP (UPF0339 family)
MGKFEIKTRINGDYQFNLKANNGEILLVSDSYITRTACENGIELVKRILFTITDRGEIEVSQPSEKVTLYNIESIREYLNKLRTQKLNHGNR